MPITIEQAEEARDPLHPDVIALRRRLSGWEVVLDAFTHHYVAKHPNHNGEQRAYFGKVGLGVWVWGSTPTELVERCGALPEALASTLGLPS